MRQQPAQREADRVDQRHHQQHGDDDGGRLLHLKQRQVVFQHLSQAAGADHAEYGGGADVVLPAVQRVGHHLRQRLRQRGVEEGRQRAGAVGAQALFRQRRDVFQRVGKQPSQHAGGVRGQRQRAAERPEADGDQRDRGPHQFRDRAQHIEHAAHHGARRAAPASGAGQGQRQADAGGDRGLGQERRRHVGRRETGQKLGHVVDRFERQEGAPRYRQRRETGRHQQQQKSKQHQRGPGARRRRRHGRRRGGGSVDHHARRFLNILETTSAASTSSTNTISIEDTSPPSILRSDSSMR